MRRMTSGDIVIEGEFRGMHSGRATVPAGAFASVSGMINGDLIVEPGARVSVRGMINGALIDRGGAIDVRGMVGELVRG
jgi:hypothetical protein